MPSEPNAAVECSFGVAKAQLRLPQDATSKLHTHVDAPEYAQARPLFVVDMYLVFMPLFESFICSSIVSLERELITQMCCRVSLRVHMTQTADERDQWVADICKHAEIQLETKRMRYSRRSTNVHRMIQGRLVDLQVTFLFFKSLPVAWLHMRV